MDIGKIDELDPAELEQLVYVLMRALEVSISWYMRAVERRDNLPYGDADYLMRRDKLVEVAINDANSFIASEHRESCDRVPPAERATNNDREQQLRTELGGANESSP